MRLALPLLALLLATPAAATELFGGLHAQGVSTPFSLQADRENGVALSGGIRGAGLWGTPIQPYAFVSVSAAGDTNFLAAGLSARIGGDSLYVRPGLGLAVHDGSAQRFTDDRRLALGSRILLEPELAIGTRLSDRLSLEASWVHLSHAQLFSGQNPGIDNVGLRLNLKL